MSAPIFALMRLVPWLPARLRVAVGDVAGALAFRLIAERRQVTRRNLERCRPELDASARERLARGHFRAFCRSFVDRAVLWWGSREAILGMVEVAGLEHLRAAAKEGPVILLVPHFVGLDAGLTRLGAEVDLVVMYANQKDPRFGALLARGRSRFGRQCLVSRQQGIRATLAALRAGRPFYYLPDQDYGPRDAVFVPFFGVPAATVTGLSRLARIAGARVLPALTRMLPGGRYRLEIEPPWRDFPGADVVADTARMNAWIESRVREMPEQYFWMHKRFKTRPPGEPRFY